MGILLNLFDKLIVEHGSAAVRGDHIALLREQLQVVEKQVEKLETENTELKKQLSQKTKQLEASTSGDEFVEHRGTLFKRKPEGGYHQTAYCPTCKRVARTLDNDFPYSCKSCGWSVNITPNDLKRIIQELPQ